MHKKHPVVIFESGARVEVQPEIGELVCKCGHPETWHYFGFRCTIPKCECTKFTRRQISSFVGEQHHE